MTVAEKATHNLKWRILTGQLHPGEAITVRSVADLLDIGITPARDALMRLQQEGLVDVRPRGTIVRKWTIEEMRAHYQMRLAVEKVALFWAAENMSPSLHRKLTALCDLQEEYSRTGQHERRTDADVKFHASLIGAAQNKEVTRIAGFLRSLGPILPSTARRYSLSESLEAVSEHRQIADLLLKGKVEEASEVLQRHLTSPLTHLAGSGLDEIAGILGSVEATARVVRE